VLNVVSSNFPVPTGTPFKLMEPEIFKEPVKFTEPLIFCEPVNEFDPVVAIIVGSKYTKPLLAILFKISFVTDMELPILRWWSQ
jgi:hypothetical protein